MTHCRVVTATALYDGHDASIEIIRRVLQDAGAQVVHLGHSRAVSEVVSTALQEDADAIAISSYQGCHMEYFTYLRKQLDANGGKHINIFGGGGGVIIQRDIDKLEAMGVTKIFSVEDGRNLGLEGMAKFIIEKSRREASENLDFAKLTPDTVCELAAIITSIELGKTGIPDTERNVPVIGFTGTGGAGKSTLIDELMRRLLIDFPSMRLATLCVDPAFTTDGGALLGDRIRINTSMHDRVFLRSITSHGTAGGLPKVTSEILKLLKHVGFDLIIVETPGIGQGDAQVVSLVDLSLYVMTSDFGSPSQLEKIAMLHSADVVALNKYDHRGSQDALKLIRKQVQRSRKLFSESLDSMPVFPTMATFFNDKGTTALYWEMLRLLDDKTSSSFATTAKHADHAIHGSVIPQYDDAVIIIPTRSNYLAEAAACVRGYHKKWDEQGDIAHKLDCFETTLKHVDSDELVALRASTEAQLCAEAKHMITSWDGIKETYGKDVLEYKVRNKLFTRPLSTTTQSYTRMPKISLPKSMDMRQLIKFMSNENVPGAFPFTAGVFPLKRDEEEPTRLFAGEGTPHKSNQRLKLLQNDRPGNRLSCAFDAVTLYGSDPAERLDVYGNIGEGGASIATVEDMEELYSGFDLNAPDASVSMTINGPAPILLAFFFNVAYRQALRKALRDTGKLNISEAECLIPGSGGMEYDDLMNSMSESESNAIWINVIQNVRGTVQADILKEDQVQNTCIFSKEFALKVMGDIQWFFCDNHIHNFYSISVSGYHMGEGGATPVQELAYTLANGLTYVEYFKHRGMDVNDFGKSLSFFFSNGMDAEYSVMGRVARRIWAIVMRDMYGADERAQKLKYHIQTSGRSLHAQEMQFNDIRTTLEALLATFDNTLSLHTNSYDEAISVPSEEAVRRAIAVQIIVNHEFGLTACENPWQGSYIINELTDLVEEAVLQEFDAISQRGGVLGAMEFCYQRSCIQQSSIDYETKKTSGEIPIVGVNTFIDPNGVVEDANVRHCSEEEKQERLSTIAAFKAKHKAKADDKLAMLKQGVIDGRNVFDMLIDVSRYATIGQMSAVLFETGGQYRRGL